MADAGPGTVIGHYRLVRRLGAGGMGEVYLAERRSDYQQRVAVKLIRPEMANPEVLRRFAVERQTLAALNHPRIVRLLDGGSTADGAPYLVEEYVEGVPIDRAAAERDLSVPERLWLFLKVCEAVHHAHQSLVVHCDLKPANILVTAAGEPMLLDFGIAKLLDPGLLGMTLRMGRETRAGFTPQYASPEQMLGLPVTTATDVYALGVILYELLTGRCPHPMEGSMADWIRSICERDAERPSTAVRRTGGQPGPAVVPKAHSAERLLRGDLDAIVLKVLRKEPRERYGSVDQMAEDIRRHLEGRPVAARRNTSAYVLRKFVTRHKWGAAAALALTAAVAGGVWSTLYQARLAARRFEDVRSLARTFLFEVHDAIQDLPGSTPARSLIARTGAQYLDRLARDARADRTLELEVAEGYLKIGDVAGNPYGANLGDTGKAIENYRKALALAESGGDSSAQSRQLAARIHENLAGVLAFASRGNEALQHAQTAIVLYKEVAQAGPSSAEAALDLARGYETLGDLQGGARGIHAARFEEARASYEQALALIPRLAANHPGAPRATRARAVILMKLGDSQSRTFKLAGAMTQYRAALEAAEQLQAADPNNTRARALVTTVLNKIADVHTRLEQNGDAEAAYKRALSIHDAALAADPNNSQARSGVAISQKNLGDLYYYNLRRFPDALRCYRRAAELMELESQADPANVVWKQNLSEVLTYVASALLELNQPAEAQRQAKRGLALAKEIADRPGATHDQIYNYAWLGVTVEPPVLRDGRAVLPYAKRAAEMSQGKDPYDLHVLAKAHAASGDFAQAEEAEARALALFPPVEPGQPVPGARQSVENDLAAYRKALEQARRAGGAARAAGSRATTEVAFLLEDWLRTPGWRREGSLVRRRGGDFVLASPVFARGSVEFTVTALRGDRLAWALEYRDLANYLLFELDENNLTAHRLAEGRRTRMFAAPHGLPRGAAVRARIQVTGTAILQSVFRDGDWRPAGEPIPGPAPGRFGFHVPGRDEIGLSDFRLTIEHE
jgi:non-specific serine/threonine protein kinase/serine/threonine-protein kinase